MNSCLPSDTISMSTRMLEAGSANAMETLAKRFKTGYLPDLATSRAPGFWNTSEARTGLPGLGNDYWKYTRAHLQASSLPPSFTDEFKKPAVEYTQAQVSEFLCTLRQICSDSGGFSEIMWNAAEVQVRPKKFPLLFVPILPCPRFQYQNGVEIKTENVTVYHSTRESNLANIVFSGLHPSPMSHRIVGLWCNYDLDQALTWTPTVVDLAPTLALSVQGDRSTVRQNRHIAAGNYNRMVFTPFENSLLPSIVIRFLITGIPSWQRLAWYTALKRSLRHSFRIILQLPCNDQFEAPENLVYTLAARTLLLTSQRLAYGGSCLKDLTVGIHTGLEYTVVAQLSAMLADLCWTLNLSSVEHRRDRLINPWLEQFPKPLLHVLLQFFPTLNQFTSSRPTGTVPVWKLDQVPKVDKIGQTAVDNIYASDPTQIRCSLLNRVSNATVTILSGVLMYCNRDTAGH